jgi:hypothetical protein
VTSVEIKLDGATADSITSYTATKEGTTYSRGSEGYFTGVPSPGQENTKVSDSQDATTTQTGSQATIPQMSPPSSDIILYMPSEKIVIAGAPTVFSVKGVTRAGKAIDALTFTWSFGDGGTRTGSTTMYRYFYPGTYIAQTEGTNSSVYGVGRMSVRVVAPDITISPIMFGKYGSYIDITNPNYYDLDVSGWKISIDGGLFSFPLNTILAQGVTHVSGEAMGFATTPVSSSTLVKLLFPNNEEVIRINQSALTQAKSPFTNVQQVATESLLKSKIKPQLKVTKSVVNTSTVSTSSFIKAESSQISKKDTRIASFFKTLLR